MNPSPSLKSSKSKNHAGGKRVLVTGVSGFIGGELALALHADGYKVSGLVRKTSTPSKGLDDLRGKVDFYEGDLTDYSGLSAILRQALPDIIVNLAAITPVSYSFDHPQEVTRVNYEGVINISEAARRELPNLELFVHSSTMEVPGIQPHKPFTEDLVPRPNCPYAVAKLASEKFLQYLWQSYKFPAVILRQTNTFGRKLNDYFVTEAFVTAMLKNSKVVNFGSPDPVRNFLFIDDLCDLYRAILKNHEEKDYGELFFTGPDNGVTIEDLAAIIAEEIGWKGQINWRTREQRVGEVMYLNSLNAKATNHFGWSPKITLREGIARTVKFWRAKIKAEKR